MRSFFLLNFFCYDCFKKVILNFDLNDEKKKRRRRKKNRQNLLPSNTCSTNRMEWKEHIKCINRFLYLNLQIKNFSPSLSLVLYSHQKYIKKKLKENCHHRYCCFYSHLHTHTHNFNVSVLRTWCPPTSMRKNSIETKRNKRANNSIEGIRKWNITTHTYVYVDTRRKRSSTMKQTSQWLVKKTTFL